VAGAREPGAIRWARAWQLLSTTWRFPKAEAARGNALDLDAPWPPEPVIRGLWKAPRGPEKEPKDITQEQEPAQKFDPISRFRRKIWTPNQEQMAEPGTAAGNMISRASAACLYRMSRMDTERSSKSTTRAHGYPGK
jgi:hypothetical protein